MKNLKKTYLQKPSNFDLVDRTEEMKIPVEIMEGLQSILIAENADITIEELVYNIIQELIEEYNDITEDIEAVK